MSDVGKAEGDKSSLQSLREWAHKEFAMPYQGQPYSIPTFKDFEEDGRKRALKEIIDRIDNLLKK